jgi:hypothetical protein
MLCEAFFNFQPSTEGGSFKIKESTPLRAFIPLLSTSVNNNSSNCDLIFTIYDFDASFGLTSYFKYKT